jgi:hypothetical protein
MTLWMMEKLSGRPPSRFAVTLAVWSQALLSAGSAGELIASGLASGALGDELEASADAMGDIPPFMLESLLAAYLKGMAFVHGIAGQGWDAVARIYDDPPRSSEQILHPEKYLRRDDPVTIEFPDFVGEDSLLNWTLLDSNVIGEFQWRLIFDEFSFGLRSAGIAAGWDGDRFAVLERDGRLLLLLLSAWDGPEDAREFAAAYQELLLEKYPDRDEAWTVETRGSEVLIVEGGERARVPDYLDIIARAVRRN